MMPLRATHAKLALSALGLAVLTGCASVSLDQNINRVNDEAGSFTGGKLALARTLDERDQRAQAAQALLAQPLEQKDAVQLALVNSPSLQTLLAQGWAESADAAQAGRIANPIFSFERMVAGDELEFGRALSFGLLDLLTLPARHGGATRRIEQAQLRLTSDVVDQITRVRQSWVRAVAAQQTLKYAKQVYDSAEAGAELAKRISRRAWVACKATVCGSIGCLGSSGNRSGSLSVCSCASSSPSSRTSSSRLAVAWCCAALSRVAASA